ERGLFDFLGGGWRWRGGMLRRDLRHGRGRGRSLRRGGRLLGGCGGRRRCRDFRGGDGEIRGYGHVGGARDEQRQTTECGQQQGRGHQQAVPAPRSQPRNGNGGPWRRPVPVPQVEILLID